MTSNANAINTSAQSPMSSRCTTKPYSECDRDELLDILRLRDGVIQILESELQVLSVQLESIGAGGATGQRLIGRPAMPADTRGAQPLDPRKFLIRDIARFFDMPPDILAVTEQEEEEWKRMEAQRG